MSRLYSSPEVASLGVICVGLSLSQSLRPIGYALRAPNRSVVRFQTNLAVRRGQQGRAPLQSSLTPLAAPNHLAAKTSTDFSRELSSAISGFRSLCGREQRSPLKPSRSN